MGSASSFPLVNKDRGEIPAYVQRDGAWCGICLQGSSGIGLFQEPARFNEPKPYDLYQVSDDHWAALKLRIDPLARKILDPHRSIALAGFLCLLLSLVFSVVRPSIHELGGVSNSSGGSAEARGIDDIYNDAAMYYGGSDGDDNVDYGSYYGAEGENDGSYSGYKNVGTDDVREDDAIHAEYMYKKMELEYQLRYWNFGFGIVVFALLVVTLNMAKGMTRRNATYDEKMEEVCREMSPRFQTEGYEVAYRTNQRGICFPIMRPVRVIVFYRSGGRSEDNGNSPGSARSNATSHPPSPTHSTPQGFHQNPYFATSNDGDGGSPQSLLQMMRSTESALDRQAADGSSKNENAEQGIIVVQVPEGMVSGNMMSITTPSGGQVHASVPEGVKEGEQFTVQVPMSMIHGSDHSPQNLVDDFQKEQSHWQPGLGSSTPTEHVAV